MRKAENGFMISNGISFLDKEKEKSNSNMAEKTAPKTAALIIITETEEKELSFPESFAAITLILSNCFYKAYSKELSAIPCYSLGVVLATTAFLRIRILTRSLPVSITRVSSFMLTTLPMMPP